MGKTGFGVVLCSLEHRWALDLKEESGFRASCVKLYFV